MKIVFFIFFKGSGEFFTINNGLKYKAEGQKAGCCILWKLYKLVIPSGNMFHVQRRPYRRQEQEPQLVRNGRSLTRHGGCFLIIVVGNKKKKYLIE